MDAPACPVCGSPMRQTRRGATLARRGPSWVCPVAERECVADARGHLKMIPGALHTDVRAYRGEE